MLTLVIKKITNKNDTQKKVFLGLVYYSKYVNSLILLIYKFILAYIK